MLKPLSGSWIEFQHHNTIEGKYWNPICRGFTQEQWRAKIREMKELGMKYLVLLCTSLVGPDTAESYFDTDIYPFAPNFGCPNPLQVLMDEAEKQEMRVFMSVGYYGNWLDVMNNMVSPEVEKRAFRAMEQVYALFGHYKSFYGWYYPDETCINGHYHPDFMAYANRYSAFAHALNPKHKTLIAPYGTNMLVTDDAYVRQLETLDVDFVAYQDEVGVRKSREDQTEKYYEALRRAHDKAGRSALWADVELFGFEGEVYQSALLPSRVERLEKQIKAVAPYCDELLCYQYLGMMNKPGSIAFCGHPDSIRYYQDYRELIGK